MKTIEASQLRQEISAALNIVAFGGERIAINRHGKPVAVLVSIDDLKALEALDEQEDLKRVKKALKREGIDCLGRGEEKTGIRLGSRLTKMSF